MSSTVDSILDLLSIESPLIDSKSPVKLDDSDVDVTITQLANGLRDSGVAFSPVKSFSPPLLTEEKVISTVVKQVPHIQKPMRKLLFDKGETHIYNMFLKIYNQTLPPPGMKSETIAIIWRGCEPNELINIGITGSAGGKKSGYRFKTS